MEFDELSLENFSPSVVQDKVLLVIRSMRERGWDAARYRILDYEEDWLAFYCKAINLTVQPIAD